jgi:DNA-binding NtrC family response regulator
MIQKILVADDEDLAREFMCEALESLDHNLDISTARDGEEACDLLDGHTYDVVFTDLKMPRKDGLQVLQKMRTTPEPGEVVIVTGFGDVNTAVEAMKQGSFDYLLKPICVEQVEVLMQKIREHRRLVEQNRYLQAELNEVSGPSRIIGESAAMKDVCANAVYVAATNATVLLQGESGTGKEMISRLIHESSPRRDGPFVRVNCAALSESILESELFGHEKGAFTGAHSSKPGRFELADGGTLMLDEITETSEKLQAELLRVIEEKEFERVGGTRTIQVDIRIIATTNRDIKREVAEGSFREDLFYRLNVVPIMLPPLRVREGDVELLQRHFSRKFARHLGKPVPEMSEEAMQAFRRYGWPGNVRELENLVQRLVIMDQKGAVELDDLPDYVTGRGRYFTEELALGPTLEDVERQVILKTLRETNGNRTRAAEKLDVSTRTIRNKLKKYTEEGVLPEELS